ncbi:DUF1365 domain-containing protein [Salinarimonas ramus]|uniref:DUF1365 domain-containing protein n=1 Tax=Salinarimonas ramus TaxID=690164 RepID=A0A917Q4T1_9HYPH|nr:DUF1365 domain-containing protein [Salinarimonas ramus]GGK22555.1 DUF1365 domain-containing protein [Salinarimonas ramus]
MSAAGDRGEDRRPPPACLYVGSVMHARLRPKPHRFRYRVFTLLVDLDRLEETDRLSPLFSVGRMNLVSFRARDHGGRGAQPLADWARDTFAAHGIAVARVRLLAYPRIFGFAFNPIALFYGYGAEGALAGVIAEVRNTFGERHHYVLPAGPERARAQKALHVSPFLSMEHVYRFALPAPDARANVSIVERDASGPVLTALLSGERRALTTGGLLAALARTPLMTLKVVAAIHWEALRLLAKGVPVHRHPRSQPTGRAARAALAAAEARGTKDAAASR